MLYLLDTDTGSCAIRGASAALDAALAAAVPGSLAISAVTRAERTGSYPLCGSMADTIS